MPFVFSEKDFKRIEKSVRATERMTGLQQRRGRPVMGKAGGHFIAKVDSEAIGGGYYNCHLQTLDADDWNTTNVDQLDDIGDSVVVLNLPEIPITDDDDSHKLSAGDEIMCWKSTDDEGNTRYVGIAALRYTACP